MHHIVQIMYSEHFHVTPCQWHWPSLVSMTLHVF
uniref:Uncharacterized protein n=1 Tax=Anguilla anguilla TaxID=7936 RepID=A0A0E9P943_ANGAN